MGRSLAHDDLPPSEDPIWNQLGAEVLDELKTPKTVRQLKSWARGERLEIGRLVNTLAWLGLHGKVRVDRTTAEPLWQRAPKPLPEEAVKAAPMPKNCGHCGGLMKAEPQRLACVICGRSIYPPLADGDEDCGTGFL